MYNKKFLKSIIEKTVIASDYLADQCLSSPNPFVALQLLAGEAPSILGKRYVQKDRKTGIETSISIITSELTFPSLEFQVEKTRRKSKYGYFTEEEASMTYDELSFATMENIGKTRETSADKPFGERVVIYGPFGEIDQDTESFSYLERYC